VKSHCLGPPVGPGADLVPQVGARALGGAHLTMTVQSVTGDDLATGNGIGEDTLGSADHGSGGTDIVVVTQEGDAKGLGVPVGGMGTDSVPATTLVDSAITSDEEVVANIGPAQAVHVVGLDVAQFLGTGSAGAAVVASGVVNHSVAQVVAKGDLAPGSASSPRGLRDDGDSEDCLGAHKYGQKNDCLVCHGCRLFYAN